MLFCNQNNTLEQYRSAIHDFYVSLLSCKGWFKKGGSGLISDDCP